MESQWPVHHVGFTVSNLQQSVDFYCRALNATRVREPYSFSERDNDLVTRGVHMEGATISNAFISTGNTLLEFLEYHNPEGKPYTLRNGDIGAAHVCVRVDNIDEVYARLEREGVKFLSPVNECQDGLVKGARWAYFKDPDDISVEILQVPETLDINA